MRSWVVGVVLVVGVVAGEAFNGEPPQLQGVAGGGAAAVDVPPQHDNHLQPAQLVAKPRSKTFPIVKLADDEACRDDVRRLCHEPHSNFDVLECLQDQKRDLKDVINDNCNHLLWSYKMNLTRSGRIEELAKEVCRAEMQHCDNQTTPGHTVACMVEKLKEVKDEKCHQYLLRLASIVFSDYRYIEGMVASCDNTIARFNCGRLDKEKAQFHSQGSTIECLSGHLADLEPQCQKQILRLAELQSDDFHLDRALYFACREARELFCENIRAGEGRVYKCLMKHKMERGMSSQCANQLSRRQKLTVQNYRANKGIVRACKKAIVENSCRKGSADDAHDVKLSRILLCLEDALRSGKPIDGTCKEEMLEHRRQLMSDFQLSPELKTHCQKELQTFCNNGLETGGRTLHCLMKHSRGRNTRDNFSPECRSKIETLIKETDAGEDWRVDPVLHEACQPMVESACKDVRGGNARVMRCLMRHLDSSEMPSACEAALLEIQYFVSRDWKLDPQLYAACSNAATEICGARKDWAGTTGLDISQRRGSHVLSCLFRYAYHPNTKLRLDSTCTQEMQRVMHERAAYVDLHPEIEMVCMSFLADLCSEHTGPGDEIECLQTNLEKLDRECKDAVSNYTEAEAKDTRLNAHLTAHCTAAIAEMCNSEAHSEDEDDSLMDCLIRHKNVGPMRKYSKCRAVIEDFQLISMKDYSFTPKFKEACQQDVGNLCHNPKPKNKPEVIDCLSSSIRESILHNTNHEVSKSCRQQLKQQLFQRHENIKFDPRLKHLCEEDIKIFCSSVPRGRGAVLECLRSNKDKLQSSCHWVLFQREQEELQDQRTDVVLVTACRQMIMQYCHDVESDKLLSCLKIKKGEPNFDMTCRGVVVRRMVEQTTDIRLNPQLLKACRNDVAKFCYNIFDRITNSTTELNGRITECLMKQLPSHKLTTSCKSKMLGMTRTAALNYRMDPILTRKCDSDMKVLCVENIADEAEQTNEEKRGHMLECLKLAFEQDKIQSQECSSHIAHVIETQHMDIHVDPLLNEACGIDDSKYCEGKEKGQHLACLLDVLDRNPSGLKIGCREILRIRREMFSAAMKQTNIQGVRELVTHVSNSSERTYLLLVFISIIGIIFVGGLSCGRMTKRYKLLKDR